MISGTASRGRHGARPPPSGGAPHRTFALPPAKGREPHQNLKRCKNRRWDFPPQPSRPGRVAGKARRVGSRPPPQHPSSFLSHLSFQEEGRRGTQPTPSPRLCPVPSACRRQGEGRRGRYCFWNAKQLAHALMAPHAERGGVRKKDTGTERRKAQQTWLHDAEPASETPTPAFRRSVTGGSHAAMRPSTALTGRERRTCPNRHRLVGLSASPS